MKVCLETTIIMHMEGNNYLSQISKCRSDGGHLDPERILKVMTVFPKQLDKIYGENRGISDESNILT